AVLAELERISERGGVLGAMETGYQRGRIQDESMLYEHRKHDGSLPIIGVNTFLPADGGEPAGPVELRRSDDAEKQDQLERLRRFQADHAADRPAALDALRQAALDGSNTFDALMHAVRHCSLGEITATLFEVGGKYRRNV
ncbi:MAG TPA: methylmalonyl-CoA mutase family protein, partial [Acidimicrobiales bacterium]|nr:methylmalonyl-CoA mutase family protein [Acidimicrobiales bacterium]